MKKRKIGTRISTMLLSAAMTSTMLIPADVGTQTVAAETVKKVASLSTSAIKGPVTEKTYDSETGYMNPWLGSYVWYGKYDGEPLKYRVLSPKTTEYGGTTMFLDCENVLYEVAYDKDGEPNSGQTYPNEWGGSDLQYSLNGLDFLWKSNGFCEPERYAIKGSTIASHSREMDTDAKGILSRSHITDFTDFTALTGEKIFVLDIGEMIPKYGYFYPGKKCLTGDYWIWWTRSAHKPITEDYGGCVGYVPNYVYSTGNVRGQNFSLPIGASPAFNVDLNSVIFSSVVSGTAGEDNAEYKLTLRDTKINLAIKENIDGFLSTAKIGPEKTYVSLRLQLSGAEADNVTQVSALVLDKEYTPGNTNNATILHYEKMTIPGNISDLKTVGSASFGLPASFNLDDWGSKYYVYVLAEEVNGSHESDYASVPISVEKPQKTTSLISASVKYPSITKGTAQEFEVQTTSDVKYLMLYAEGGTTLVKSWAASGNSTVSGDRRTWNVSQVINTAGDRKLIFYGGTTNTTSATNSYAVLFKVLNTGVISASAKNAVIPKGGEQVFTVKTTSDAKYLVEYAEDGTKVKTWTADSNNSTVSGNVRTWTVKQNIATAGNRTLAFKAGTTSTPTAAQRTASFKVETVWVISASAKNATIGKGGTQTFTVKTTNNATFLMLYAEGGNLVKTWMASGNSTVSEDARIWTVDLAIGTAGNRELTLKACRTTTPKAGQTLTPSPLGKTVKFAVVEKKLVSASAKYAGITKASMQGFTVTTSADVQYLMLYSEDGKTLVKSWPASGNSTVGADKIRTWYVMQAINTAGNRKLVFKGGTNNTTAVTNALTVSFKVENTGVITASAKNATITKGATQTFTVTTTADCKYLAEYAENGNLVTSWTANSSNSKVSGNVRTWTVTQTINTAGKRTLTFKAGISSPTSAERNVSFTVQ